MKKKLLFAVIFLFTIISTIEVFAQEAVTIHASKNNTLYESPDGSLSNGKGDHIFAGVTNNNEIRRVLLFFDLSEIQEGAQIESVELQLVMNRTVSGDASVTIHEILSDWGEGDSNAGGEEGTGGPAADGDATWIHTFLPDETWENAGGDFNSFSASSMNVGNTGTYSWPSTPEFVDLVQKWLDTPAENFGILVHGDESGGISAKRFSSRHHPIEGNRPVLIVEYSGETTYRENKPELPKVVALNQNYPNPFNPQTLISFSLPSASNVELVVHDMLGREIRTLVNEIVQPGTYEIVFDASELPSGVYIYTLRTGNQLLSRKLTVIK